MDFDSLALLAVDSVFDTIGTDGVYHSTTGGPLTIKIVRRPRDAVITGFSSTSHFQDGGRFEVRASDFGGVPPIAGDKIMFGTTLFEVRGDPFFGDEQHKVYFLDCVPCRP
jgi:hypothetical protein